MRTCEKLGKSVQNWVKNSEEPEPCEELCGMVWGNHMSNYEETE